MALKDCLKKFGKSISEKDKAALQALLDAGLDEKVVIGQYIKALEMDRLEGAPIGFSAGDNFFGTGNFEPAIQAAKDYMESIGMEYTPPTFYAKVDEKRASRIAAEYDRMRHAPSNPEVKKAYRAMIKETIAQYEFILKTGLVVEAINGANPYKRTIDVINDVRDNNHIYYFKTVDGFGTDANFDPKSNPLLEETEFVSADGQPMLVNDVFRVVHDYFGHVKNGVTFRAIGEENAWQSHAAMYSPLARRAMTSETRGQNSWLNYGPHGEKNRTAKVEDTIFADQKTGLLPLWASEEARLSADERNKRFESLLSEGKTGFEGAIDDDGYVEIIHYSDEQLSRNSPRKWGQGLSGRVRSERQRIKGGVPRTYFGIESAIQNGYKKEAGLGRLRYVAKVHGSLLYNLGRDPENFYNLDPDVTEKKIREANYSGFFVADPSFGKIVAVFDELDLTPSDKPPVHEIQTLHQAQRNMIGLYSAVEQAIMDMDLQQWRETSKDSTEYQVVSLTNEEKGRKIGIKRFDSEEEAKAKAEELSFTSMVSDWEVRKVAVKKANAKEIWAKLSKTKGVKGEELELLDIENYLQTKEKFTRDEVIQFVRDNGVVIEEIVADEQKTDEEIEWDHYGDVVNERGMWEHRIDDYIYDFDNDDDTWFWGQEERREWLEENIQLAMDKYGDIIEDDNLEEYNDLIESEDWEGVVDFFDALGKDWEQDFKEDMRSKFNELAEEKAEEEYLNDPVYKWESSNSDYRIQGNDDFGYEAYHPSYGFVVEGGNVFSLSEAQLQVNYHAQENGLAGSTDGENVAKFEWAIDGTQPYDNYRELKLTLPEVQDDFYYDAHFDERNILSFLRVTDRSLPDVKGNNPPIYTAESITVEYEYNDQYVSAHKAVIKSGDEEIAKVSIESKEGIQDVIDKLKNAPFGKNVSGLTTDGKGGLIGKVGSLKKTVSHYFVDEMQSDMHQTGKKKGYKYEMTHEEFVELEDRKDDLLAKIAKEYRGIHGSIATTIRNYESQPEIKAVNILMRMSKGMSIENIIKHERINPNLYISLVHDSEAAWRSGIFEKHKDDFNELFDIQSKLQADREGVSADFAFKGDKSWQALTLKRALIQAIEDGYSHLSWADAEMVSTRWHERYREAYTIQYDGTMKGIIQKLTGIEPKKYNFKTGELITKKSTKANTWQKDAAEKKLEEVDLRISYYEQVHKFKSDSDAYKRKRVDARIKDRFEKLLQEKEKLNDLILKLESEETDDFNSAYWSIPITEELKEKVLGKGFPLFQDGDESSRGSLTLLSDSSRIMKLTYKSDASTVPHELAHLFLETEKQLAEIYGKTENHKRMLNWLGVNSFSEITTEHHEKFAETFEVYLQDGKAPSMALKEVFSRFRTWITQVYKNFRKDPRFRAQLTEESRYIFDRMLATEEEIEAMSSNEAYTPLFKSKEQAGMTDEEFEEYQKNPAKAKRKAQQSLDKQIMAIIKKKKTDEWAEEKAFIVDEEVERLKETRPYQIQEVLKTNPLDLDLLREHLGIPAPARGDDRFIPERTDSLLTLATKLGGLNMSLWSQLGIDESILKDRKKNNRLVGKPMFRKDSGMSPEELVAIAKENGFGDMINEENVVDMVTAELGGESIISPEGQQLAMERERKLAEGGTSAKQEEYVSKFVKKHGRKGGADPEIVAQYYGYETVQDMIRDVAFLVPIKEKAAENAEQIMITQYGDILNNGTIEQEVKEAITNEDQAKALLSEVKALSKKAGKPDRINREQLKSQAEQLVSSMKKSEIKPQKFYRAMIKAAEKAAVAKTDEERLQAKIQQLANHYLYRESQKTLDEIEKQIKYVRKMQQKTWRANEVGGDYRRIISLMANLYDARTSKEERSMDDVMDLLNWYSTQVENDASNYAQILDPNLIKVMAARQESLDKGERFNPDGYKFPRLDDLTAEEIRGFYDQLRHFRFIGGREAQGKKNELALKREELAGSILKNGGKDYDDQKGVPDKYQRIKRLGSAYGYKQLSLRNMVRKLDNEWKENDGKAFEMIFRDIEDAHNRKIKLHGQMYDLMKAELKDLYKLRLNRKKVKYRLSDGRDWALGSEHRFMLALYWGTESSREAIMQGYGVTNEDVIKILSTMSKEELNTVNQMWRINEHLWPDLAKTVIEHEGLAPPKLEATPFMINGVQMTGGHMRLFYDSLDVEVRNEQQKAVDSAKIMPTKAGSAHARVGSGGRPVMLDISNISRSIDDVIHYIAFADTGARIRNLVNSSEVKSVIEQKHGVGFHQSFVNVINSITGNRQSSGITPAIARAMSYLRGAATARHLMYSVRNTLQQPTAIPIAMQEVGVANWLHASKDFWSRNGHDEIKAFVNERSKFMEERGSFVNREAAENVRQLSVQSSQSRKMWQTFMDLGFSPQTFVDSLIAYPTWIVKYEEELSKHGNEAKAISAADTAVSESVGSGTDLHLSGMFQSTNDELTKGFTMFGSWFSAYFQRMYRDTQGFSTVNSKDALYTLVTTPLIVATMSAIIIMDIPDEDDEEESLWSWVAEQYLKFMGGTVVFLRDAVGYATSGFGPTTPYIGFFKGVGQAYKGVSDMASEDSERSTYKNVSDILKGVSSATPIPSAGNITRVLDYMDSYEKGEEEGGIMAPYQALVEGKDKN